MPFPIPASVIEKLGHDAISQIKPAQLVPLFVDAVKYEVAQYDDADKAAIEADLAQILKSAEDIVSHIKAAHEKKAAG